MAVLQRVSFLPNERLDTPDMRAIDGFGLNDWRFFLSGFMSPFSLILTGFEITNYSTIFTVPGFTLTLNDVVLFHSQATTQAAGFYVFAGTEPNFTVNLSPNATNFVECTLTNSAGTPDTRAFWDQAANGGAGAEFIETVDTVINLNLSVTSNVTSFTSGLMPLYKVITNSSGVVTSVTDCRNLIFRLGTGGNSPNPANDFAWPNLPDASHARLETPITANSYTPTNAPFQGGDKNIKYFKQWMDAVMSSIKEIKGTPYWYMIGGGGGGSGSVPAAYQNAALLTFTGGTWGQTSTVGDLSLTGNSTLHRLGLTNPVILDAFASISLSTYPAFYIILPLTDTATTYSMGADAATPVFPQAVSATSSTTITVGLGGNYITTGGNLLVSGEPFAYTTYTPGTGLFAGVTPDPSGLVAAGEYVYQTDNAGVGFYHQSIASVVPGVIGGVSEGAERTVWLAYFDGTHTIELRNTDLLPNSTVNVGSASSLKTIQGVKFVSSTGTDSTGDGRIMNPFATIAGALASITDNTVNPYLISVGPGTFSGAITWKDNISLVGSGPETIISGNISFTASINSSISFERFSMPPADTLNCSFSSVLSGNNLILFRDIIGPNILISGAGGSTTVSRCHDCQFNDITVSAVSVEFYDCQIVSAVNIGTTASAVGKAFFYGGISDGATFTVQDGSTLDTVGMNGFNGGSFVFSAPGGGSLGYPIWRYDASSVTTSSITRIAGMLDEPLDRTAYIRETYRFATTTPVSTTYDDKLVLSNMASPSPVTVNLLAGTGTFGGKVLTVKDYRGDAGTNPITIVPNGSEMIDGSGSLVITTNYGAATLVWTGSEWNSITASGGGGSSTYIQATLANNQTSPANITGWSVTAARGFVAEYSISRQYNGTTLSEDTAFYTNLGTSFNGGVVAVTIQPSDQKILAGGDFTTFNGNSRNYLVRLNTDGTEDTAFAANIGSGFSGGSIECIAVQSNNQILVGGQFSTFNGNSRVNLVRLNSDGTEDTAFYTNLGTSFNAILAALVIQPADQKILVGGNFTTFNGNTRNFVARLNTDGTDDTAFETNVGSGFNNGLNNFSVQANNQILVAGEFTAFNGNSRGCVVRLNSDGTEDTTFATNLGTGFNGAIFDARVQTDQTIVVAGNTTVFNGNTRHYLAKLNSDGTENVSFYTNLGTSFSSFCSQVVEQPNGQIVVTGGFLSLNGNTRHQMVRLNADGTEDTTFATTFCVVGFNGSLGIKGTALQSNNQILVGGNFGTFNGNTRDRMVRLNNNITPPVALITQGEIRGVYRGTIPEWDVGAQVSFGDTSGITFSMTSAGQMQYMSTDIVSGSLIESIIRFIVTNL